MIVEISPLAKVVLDGSGNGRCAIGPPSGTKWALRLATQSVSSSTRQPQGFLYRGSPSGPLELVDQTFTGAAASSGKVAGPLFYPGQLLWAVWTGGDAGATATLQAYGQQGNRSDPLPPSPLGEGFSNSTAIILGNELQLGVSPNPRIVMTGNIPSVLTTWGAANNVTISEVMIMYWNATDFKWWATGTFVGQTCTFVGTYDTTNGVYVLERTLDTGAGAIETRFGSYSLNSFQEIWTTQQIKLRIGDGSNINDALVVNGTATSNAIAFNIDGTGTAETWHAVSFQNGWTNNAAGQAMQYRLVPSPSNCVQIRGEIVPGTLVDGTVICNLPSPYRPAAIQSFSARKAAGAYALLQLNTNGDLKVFDGAGSALFIFVGTPLLPLD